MVGQLPPPAWLDRGARAYRVHMPHDVTVVAACEDVGCDSWRSGWETECDEDTKDGALVANWIRSGQSGRAYRELRTAAGARLAVFRFDSGQRCFTEHRTRPGRLLVYQRGRQAAEHVSFAGLAEDYTEHMARVAELEKKG